MKPKKLYKITISDESRLENVASRTFSAPGLILLSIGCTLAAVAVGFLIVLLTPLRDIIPGRLRDSQRAATEEAIMRVDSLREAYAQNELYIANLRTVLDAGRVPRDSADAARAASYSLSPDSLLPRSPEEAGFAAMMQEREKFNVSVRASMAAEDMLLFPVSDEGIVATDSRESYAARVILTERASIMSIADGSVIAAYFDQRTRRYVVMVQHDNGFVSRISGLPSLLVGESDAILGGEILCAPPAAKSSQPAEVVVELWHNGIPVKPYDFIVGHRYRHEGA